MSAAYPNLVEQQVKLEQFMQKVENRRKYGSDCYKAHLKRTPITSKPEASLLLKRPLDTVHKNSSAPRDPRIELQRKRKLENQRKYAPANLKMDRGRTSAQQQFQNSKENKTNAEEIVKEPKLLPEDDSAVQGDFDSNGADPICVPPEVLQPSTASKSPQMASGTLKSMPSLVKSSPKADVDADFVVQNDVKQRSGVFIKAVVAAALAAVLMIYIGVDDVGAAAEWLLDLFTTVHHEDMFDF